MFSALTEVLQKTLTSMGTQLHEYSKYQMEQVNKLTEAVTQLTSSNNANKLTARNTADPENSDNSDSREHDEENDRRKSVTIHETDRSFYNKTNLAASFLSHQETSLSSVAKAVKTKDDPIWVQSSKNFLNPTIRLMKTGENRHPRKY